MKDKKEKQIKKPINDSMSWKLTKNRPFYIGDEYRIDLISTFSWVGRTSQVKIVVTNIKNIPDEKPVKHS